MNPVSGGFTPHKIKSKNDYDLLKQTALKQAKENAYIQGVQAVLNEGFGNTVANTRSRYGNVNLMPNQFLQSNFAYKDTPGNQPLDDLPNQSGSIRTEASSTNVPQQDPKEMNTDALERRLAMMAKGGQGFPGLNNRNREV